MVLFLLFNLMLIGSYAYIGGGIKYLDQIVDHPAIQSTHAIGAWILTASLVGITAVWVFLDLYTSIIAFALVLGLIGARKVDHYYFIAIALAVLPICLLNLVRIPVITLLASLVPLFVSVILDELVHNSASYFANAYIKGVLTYRPILKITVTVLPLFGILTFIHTIALWSFDITYEVVAYYFRAEGPQVE